MNFPPRIDSVSDGIIGEVKPVAQFSHCSTNPIYDELSWAMKWIFESIVWVQSTIQSALYSTVGYVKLAAKFFHARGYSINRENSIRVHILHLLNVRCPSAVSRLVISIIVWISINGFSDWTSAHISKEVLKRFPSLTYQNSFSSVMFKTSSFWICTPLNHAHPSLIGRTCWARMSMSGVGDCNFRPMFNTLCRHNVMALCSAAAFGYWPDVCRDLFLPPLMIGVNV